MCDTKMQRRAVSWEHHIASLSSREGHRVSRLLAKHRPWAVPRRGSAEPGQGPLKHQAVPEFPFGLVQGPQEVTR